MVSRRRVLTWSLLAGPALAPLRGRAEEGGGTVAQRLAGLERQGGGRLGVAMLDTAGTAPVALRGSERFPLCSTYKLLAAAFVLARVDRGEERLERRVAYGRDALVAYSPATETHAGEGMAMGALCEAAITLSDNTAGNLLLDSFGGPAALTGYLRSLGDATTRLDRREPELNEARPGDPRDTTSPLAMAETLRRMLVGDALSPASRAQLAAWMVGSRTGDKRLRAGAPAGWRVGDKTGSGADNVTNDVAVMWPPGRAPIVVTAFYVGSKAPDADRNRVLAEVGALAASL